MKKGNGYLSKIPQYLPSQSDKKEDYSHYFQTLEQKLLQESDKLTTYMGTINQVQFQPFKRMTSSPKKIKDWVAQIQNDKNNQTSGAIQKLSPVVMLQKYIQSKKNSLAPSKSQNLLGLPDKQRQKQRKLTYFPNKGEQKHPAAHYLNCKDEDTVSELKKTSSTTNSTQALLKVVDKIKRLNSSSNSSTHSSQASTKQRHKKTSIHDFQVIKYLEEGQFGSVYMVRHKITNFIYALKKIPKKIFQGDQRFINQLVRQIKIQGFLDHPNIIQLYSFFSDQEHIYLIMELCFGGNAYSLLKKQARFPEEKVKNVMKQVCHAVEFMHDNDIIHRDIKPENILMHEGIAKVCDFGWSIYSPLLRDTRCGSPLYSSPEVIQNQQYDNKIDVWNIGILAYQLLYGRVPFEIRSADDLVKVVDDDIYFPKSIPITSHAKSFIMGCLIKNPRERLTMQKLMDHEFIQE